MRTKFMLFSAIAILITLGFAACRAAAPASNDPLDGTSWELYAYRKTRPIEGSTITARFEDGQVRGSAGCNSYGGSYQVKGNNIEIGDIAWTAMACLEPEGVMDQETTVLGFLQAAQTFSFDAEDRLLIFRSDGEALTFMPAE
ncbi:MAG: META domain-containing protein [Anaerolineales bacterium]|nr:META domain-containing protein [Anaerolineales bacterium]